MKRYAKSLSAMTLMVFLVGCGPESGNEANSKGASASGDTSYFFGARIIPGDGSPAMEDMSFIVSGGKFTTIGRRK